MSNPQPSETVVDLGTQSYHVHSQKHALGGVRDGGVVPAYCTVRNDTDTAAEGASHVNEVGVAAPTPIFTDSTSYYKTAASITTIRGRVLE